MRLPLQTFASFFVAFLAGAVIQWSLLVREPLVPETKQVFAASAFAEGGFKKEGIISISLWLEVKSFGSDRSFPVIPHTLYANKVEYASRCTVRVSHSDSLAMVDNEGNAFGMAVSSQQNAVFKPWVLSSRKLEATAYDWKHYKVLRVIWNPYVRFVYGYSLLNDHLKQIGSEPFSFPRFCLNPLSVCAGRKVSVCSSLIKAAPSFLVPQSKCTFTENLHPAVDFLIDASMLGTNLTLPHFLEEALSPSVIQRTIDVFQGVGDVYAEMASLSEKLYAEHPSCLQTVYASYHSDFLLLGYPGYRLIEG